MLSYQLVDDQFCQGVSFRVDDADGLAQAIALVLIQEYTLARGIVQGTGEDGTADVALDRDEIEDIIARRLHPANVYHRDGFLFQLMMWLAAHLDLPDGDLVALPHSQAAAKGQDSIVVHRTDSAVVALTICEDKATESPRDTVRDEVWPEVRKYEAGERRDELRSSIIATLGLGGVPAEEAIRLVRGISWHGNRRYRVRVTVQGARTRRLFKGFDEIVDGAKESRRGETTHLPKMRQWMSVLSAKIETALRSYAKGE